MGSSEAPTNRVWQSGRRSHQETSFEGANGYIRLEEAQTPLRDHYAPGFAVIRLRFDHELEGFAFWKGIFTGAIERILKFIYVAGSNRRSKRPTFGTHLPGSVCAGTDTAVSLM